MLKSAAMTRAKALVALGACCVAIVTIAAADAPTLLKIASGGLWEISGAPGLKAPVRQCILEPAVLAQFEHRGKNCTRNVLSDTPSQTVIHYSCGGGGFGDSKMTMLTPRSLRIQTQGISEQLPFNYVLQARRVGDCAG